MGTIEIILLAWLSGFLMRPWLEAAWKVICHAATHKSGSGH